MGFLIEGNSGVVAEVDANRNLYVRTPDATIPANVGAQRMFSENDKGAVTGTAQLVSPESDEDFRLRVAQEAVLDTEIFGYSAQNTGKHRVDSTTLLLGFTAAGLTTNSTNLTTTGIGGALSTWAMFPLIGTTQLYCETIAAFTAQPTNNTVIEFGMFQRGVANPYAPTDGVYFRLNSSGFQGVVNRGGVETAASFTYAYTNNDTHQFIISIDERKISFWIDDVLYLEVDTPIADGLPFQAASQPYSFRHAITGGAAGAALSMILKGYTVSVGGGGYGVDPWNQGNRAFGSYQGLSGGTMGSLANYVNNSNPTAGTPTNTTAAVGSGLGGQFAETDTFAVNNDGIIQSFQNPPGTTTVQGRRLVIAGVVIDSFVSTALTGGGYVAQWCLAFGHTAVSLGTGEAANAKGARRITLGLQAVASGAVAGTVLSRVEMSFADGPIYINPGEFVQAVKKKVGTAPSAGVITHLITYIYGWE